MEPYRDSPNDEEAEANDTHQISIDLENLDDEDEEDAPVPMVAAFSSKGKFAGYEAQEDLEDATFPLNPRTMYSVKLPTLLLLLVFAIVATYAGTMKHHQKNIETNNVPPPHNVVTGVPQQSEEPAELLGHTEIQSSTPKSNDKKGKKGKAHKAKPTGEGSEVYDTIEHVEKEMAALTNRDDDDSVIAVKENLEDEEEDLIEVAIDEELEKSGLESLEEKGTKEKQKEEEAELMGTDLDVDSGGDDAEEEVIEEEIVEEVEDIVEGEFSIQKIWLNDVCVIFTMNGPLFISMLYISILSYLINLSTYLGIKEEVGLGGEDIVEDEVVVDDGLIHIEPGAVATINKSSPSRTTGGIVHLSVEGAKQISFIRFDFKDLDLAEGESITKATLKLYLTQFHKGNHGKDTFEVKVEALPHGGKWAEGTVSWKDQSISTRGSFLVDSFTVAKNKKRRLLRGESNNMNKNTERKLNVKKTLYEVDVTSAGIGPDTKHITFQLSMDEKDSAGGRLDFAGKTWKGGDAAPELVLAKG